VVDFISEVQEELRKDDYNRWFKKYGPYLMGLVVLIVLGTAFLEWRKARNASVAEKTSLSYMDAVDLMGIDDAKAKEAFLNLSQSAPNGYAGISLMRASEIEFDQGNLGPAVEYLDQAAKTFGDKRHQHLAQLKAAYILSGLDRHDEAIYRLTPLSEKDQPFEYLARELMALSSIETEDYATARKHLSFLETNPGVPESIAARATQTMMVVDLGVNSADTPVDDETIETDLPAEETATEIQDIEPGEESVETQNDNE